MPSIDARKNFALATIAVAPSPATTGLALTLATGTGSSMPMPPFNATVWPPGVAPTKTNAEILRVESIGGDAVALIARGAEGTSALAIEPGWQFAQMITAGDFEQLQVAVEAETTRAQEAEAAAIATAEAASIPLAQKGAASGVGTLDSGGHQPTSELSLSVVNDSAASPKDIDSTGVANTNVLAYDSTSGKFKPAAAGGGGGGAISLAAYGVVGDVKTVIDGAIVAGTTALTSATAAFTSADKGKMMVVNGGGKPLAGTTTGVLKTGGPIYSIPVSALAAAIPAGGVQVKHESHTQWFYTTGAAQGATAITVAQVALSSTPNYEYPIGSTVATLAPGLKTTIVAYVSSTEVTLANAASTTVTGAKVVRGTDNFAGIQAAITAAIAAGVSLFVPASGEGYGYDGGLTVPSSLAIKGDWCGETWGAGADYTHTLCPADAPHIEGSVLVCFAQATDAVTCSVVGGTFPVSDLGVRFAGEFVNTGHGFHLNPGNANGIMSTLWSNVKVWGHDGNHYGMRTHNNFECTDINLRTFGGGGQQIVSDGPSTYGNKVSLHPYHVILTLGTACAISFDTASTIMFVQYTRPQTWIYDSTAVPLPGTPNVLPPAQSALETRGGGNLAGFNVVAPDLETNCNPEIGSWLPSAGQHMGGGAAGAGSNWHNSPGTTAVQNATGTSVLYTLTADLTPTAGAAAEVIVEEAYEESMAGGWVVGEDVEPAQTTGLTFRRTFTVLIAPGRFMKITATHASLVRAMSNGVAGSE